MKKIPQASAVPYRIRHGLPEYLLITSRKGNWIFPKGIIDPGETAKDTAVKESREEAGIVGRITTPPIGGYIYKKWEAECQVTVFLMEVDAMDPHWLEGRERERGWFRVEEARTVIKRKKLLRMLDRAHAVLMARLSGGKG